MSDLENAVVGEAATLPDEKPATPVVEVQADEQQEPATAESDAPTDEQGRDEKGRFAAQKRINELTKKQWDARREADGYRQRLEQAEAEIARYRQPEAPDVETDPRGYVQHLAREEARQILEQERGQWNQQQEQQRFESVAQAYSTREQDFAAKNEGYEEAAHAFVSLVGNNPPLAEVLMLSDHGPAVVNYLGRHLDEAAQIAQLPPHLAAAAVARIEGRVSAPKPKAATSAPSPVPTLAGGSAGGVKDLSKLSYEDYKAARMKGQ